MLADEDKGLVSQVGPVQIDWPRSAGYYGGIGVALALGMVDWPIALFIGAVPLFKMLNRPGASYPERAIGQVLDGASRPVGGDSEATIQLTGPARRVQAKGANRVSVSRAMQGPRKIWEEARLLAKNTN